MVDAFINLVINGIVHAFVMLLFRYLDHGGYPGFTQERSGPKVCSLLEFSLLQTHVASFALKPPVNLDGDIVLSLRDTIQDRPHQTARAAVV